MIRTTGCKCSDHQLTQVGCDCGAEVPSIERYASVVEQRIARRLVRSILHAGHTISVNDGEAFIVRRSRDRNAILAALCTTDSDTLVVRRADGERIGFAMLIWGNGADLLSDHTDTEEMRRIVSDAEHVADTY